MKLTLDRVFKHNSEIAKGGTGLEKPSDIRETVENELSAFTKEIYETRAGKAKDSNGKDMPAYDISFSEALKLQFGFKDIKSFLGAIGIRTNSFSLESLSKHFGFNSLNKLAMEQLLIDHTSFGNPLATTDIDPTFRFIIPEIFTNAIRTGYIHGSMHQNWIASTIQMAQEKITMPLILRGDGMPSKVAEGANIPMGSIKFSRKDVSVFKIGTGFSITDELLMASNLDLLFIFLQEVGNDMAIGADAQAFTVLVNGEQADGSESAPVVGTVNGTSFQYVDIKKGFTRLTRLGLPIQRIIAGEDDGIAITGISQFEGFQGETRLANIRSIIGVPEAFNIDTWVLPTNQILFLAPSRAMVKLAYRGMLMEKRRNVQNQTEEMYVSDFINFAIVKRDARFLMSKAITYSGNPFPSYMDVDSRINATYQNV